jgi:hypothetical protein
MIGMVKLDASAVLDVLVQEHGSIIDLETVGKLLGVSPDALLNDVFSKLHHEVTDEPLSLHCCTGCLCDLIKRLMALGVEIGRRTAVDGRKQIH